MDTQQEDEQNVQMQDDELRAQAFKWVQDAPLSELRHVRSFLKGLRASTLSFSDPAKIPSRSSVQPDLAPTASTSASITAKTHKLKQTKKKNEGDDADDDDDDDGVPVERPRPFHCSKQDCIKAFTTKQALQRHEIAHDNQFQCSDPNCYDKDADGNNKMHDSENYFHRRPNLKKPWPKNAPMTVEEWIARGKPHLCTGHNVSVPREQPR